MTRTDEVTMDEQTDSINRTADAVLANHRVVRNGSLWSCKFCPASWPFGTPKPDDLGQCVPRPWRAES